jgi:hypothetical protein
MYLQVGVHSCSYTSNYDGGSAWHLPQSSILWGCRAGFAPFTVSIRSCKKKDLLAESSLHSFDLNLIWGRIQSRVGNHGILES